MQITGIKSYKYEMSENMNTLIDEQVFIKLFKEEFKGLELFRINLDLINAYVDYLNEELGYECTVDDAVASIMLNPKDIGLAFTTTEDGEHTIQFSMDLVNCEWKQYLDGKVIKSHCYYENKKEHSIDEKIQAYKEMLKDLKKATFDSLVYIDEDRLEE